MPPRIPFVLDSYRVYCSLFRTSCIDNLQTGTVKSLFDLNNASDLMKRFNKFLPNIAATLEAIKPWQQIHAPEVANPREALHAIVKKIRRVESIDVSQLNVEECRTHMDNIINQSMLHIRSTTLTFDDLLQPGLVEAVRPLELDVDNAIRRSAASRQEEYDDDKDVRDDRLAVEDDETAFDLPNGWNSGLNTSDHEGAWDDYLTKSAWHCCKCKAGSTSAGLPIRCNRCHHRPCLHCPVGPANTSPSTSLSSTTHKDVEDGILPMFESFGRKCEMGTGLTSSSGTLGHTQSTTSRKAVDTSSSAAGAPQKSSSIDPADRSIRAVRARASSVFSYWSVQEAEIFPELIEKYGSDWEAISHETGTKTSTMVNDYFHTFKDGGFTIGYLQDAKGTDGRRGSTFAIFAATSVNECN